jgi:putative ribosome biogenesis GTPase RsgA
MKTKSAKILFLTGASGAGKTALLEYIQENYKLTNVLFYYFDSIGVPSESEIISKYGSGREWQKAMTYTWINKIINEKGRHIRAIIEGQVDIQFIVDSFDNLSFSEYKVILINAEKDVRDERLIILRKQAYLATDDMESWALYLKKQAVEFGIEILDTSNITLAESADYIVNYLEN